MSINSIFSRMPKVELHFHLEGAIPIPALWSLVQKYAKTDEVESIEALENKFRFRDFPHFIKTWLWKNQFIQEYEDFTFIAQKVAEDLVSQNIVYVESFYSPIEFYLSKGLDIQEITHAIRKGFDKVSGVKINLIADLVRNFGKENTDTTLEAINESKDDGVVGIGIGGSEHLVPPEVFTDAYEKARSYGFKTTAHAGEVVGPESVWGAIKALKVDRIGHGTSAAKDSKLVEYLKKHQIPIEMCPGSNVKTGSINSLKDHPIYDFYNRGLLVSVNTDDPKMFHTSLDCEYESLMLTLNFKQDQIFDLARNSIQSLWCTDDEKQSLRKKLERFIDQIK